MRRLFEEPDPFTSYSEDHGEIDFDRGFEADSQISVNATSLFSEVESQNSIFEDELEPGSELDSDDCEVEIIWIFLEDPLLYLLKWPKLYFVSDCRGGCQGMDALHQNRKQSPISHESFFRTNRCFCTNRSVVPM